MSRVFSEQTRHDTVAFSFGKKRVDYGRGSYRSSGSNKRNRGRTG